METRGDRIARLVAVGALAFLAFLGGMAVMLVETFPATVVKNAYQGGRAYLERRSEVTSPNRYPSGLWEPARNPARGVTVHDRERAHKGFTLYTSGHDQVAILIDMDGNEVHRWQTDFHAIRDASSPVRDPVPPHRIYLRKAYLLPEGELLAVFEGLGDTPYGYGLVKLDADSNVLWSYLDHVHHSVDVAPDGRILTLTHAITHHDLGDWRRALRPPRIDDFIVILSPDGEELEKIPLMEAMHRSEYERMLSLTPFFVVDNGDILHTNSVTYIDQAMAAAFEFAEPGQILVSFREIGAIAVVDPDSQRVVWALRGPWVGQHDPDLLPNGNILLFDNNGHYGPEGRSRVIEVDPRTAGIVWSYAGTSDRPFDSVIRSSQQRLANGNTLMSESDGGRLLEVTREGEVVWEYLNPVRATADDGGERIPVVSLGGRVTEEELAPEFLARLRAGAPGAPSS